MRSVRHPRSLRRRRRAPVRLDFFGDTLEIDPRFDPETQRTVESRKHIDLVPANEMQLTAETIARFRQAYVALFGAADRDDLLYQSISDRRRYVGMEHWLAFFSDGLETIFDHVGAVPVVLDHLDDEAVGERIGLIKDHYDARRSALGAGQGSALQAGATRGTLPDARRVGRAPCQRPARPHLTLRAAGSRQRRRYRRTEGRNFSVERNAENSNVFDAVIAHIAALQQSGKRVAVACWSEGSRDRTGQVLVDHGLMTLKPVADWPAAEALDRRSLGSASSALRQASRRTKIAIIGEQDILGDRLVRPHGRTRRAAEFLSDVNALAEGDLVVHIDHGIGRFNGLKTITAAGAPHDCLEILYAGGDRVLPAGREH